MTPKPNAATNIPNAILQGAEGSLPFFAKVANMSMLMGVKATTKKGLNCWKSEGMIDVGSSIWA